MPPGFGIQSRRNDPRLLAALAAIWLLMPNVLCQMHVRYQMWPAAVSCILIGIAPELGLLHVVFSLLAAGMMASALTILQRARSPKILDAIVRFQPDAGWIMLTLGLIVLYLALAPGPAAPTGEELASLKVEMNESEAA